MKRYLVLVVAAVAALAACENGADTPSQEDGLVPIRIGLADVRSVLPVAPSLEDMDWFTLYGTASGKDPSASDYQESWLADFSYKDGAFYDLQTDDLQTETPAVVYIKPGTWRFTLYAYLPEGGAAALKGTEIVNVGAGFSETVNFTLSPQAGEEGDTGSIFIYLALPEGSDVASVETSIDGTALDPPLVIDADAVIYENTETPVGQYLFSFTLKDSADKTVAVVSDIVVVAAGAESAWQYSLTDEDLNGPPSAPSDFAAESYSVGNQSFHFTWQDNSLNETGFTLSDGNAVYTVNAASQSFDFPITDPAASATYTLKAFNAFGESATVQTSGTFTVTFDPDDQDLATQTLYINGGDTLDADMLEEPTKTGYSFGGWYTEPNGGGVEFTADTVVTGNTTVYANWVEGVKYELTQNPGYDNYICNSDDFLPLGFTVDAGERIEISFSIKTDTNMAGFYVGIGDWNNSYYDGGDEDGWIAPGWHDTKTVQADGQFHQYSWTLTALAAAPAGYNPLVFHFAINSVTTDKVTVYIKDVSIIKYLGLPPNLSLTQALTWISNNAVEGDNYTITLNDDETITPKNLSYNGQDVSITLEGGASERTVSLSSNGSLFTVGNGVTLTLGGNVTLQGRNSNTAGLVQVNSGGTLVMNDGAKVSGNSNSAGSGGGVYASGTFTMNGGEISGNSAASYGGGVYVSSGTFTMSGGAVSDNSASYGGGVYVSSGTFTKQAAGGVIYGSNAGGTLKNTATSGDLYGHAAYVVSGSKIRSATAGTGITLDSEISGSAGGWEEAISNITYSPVSGGTWSLLSDGRRRSPSISHNGVTKSRVSFTSNIANASITIQLDVSSEQGWDYAFISTLDNATATYNSGYYPGSSISGTYSVTITIPVPTAGDHFVDIGYRKDGSASNGSDCAWFKLIE